MFMKCVVRKHLYGLNGPHIATTQPKVFKPIQNKKIKQTLSTVFFNQANKPSALHPRLHSYMLLGRQEQPNTEAYKSYTCTPTTNFIQELQGNK